MQNIFSFMTESIEACFLCWIDHRKRHAIWHYLQPHRGWEGPKFFLQYQSFSNLNVNLVVVAVWIFLDLSLYVYISRQKETRSNTEKVALFSVPCYCVTASLGGLGGPRGWKFWVAPLSSHRHLSLSPPYLRTILDQLQYKREKTAPLITLF